MLAILAPMDTELTGIRRHVGSPGWAHVSLHLTGIGPTATVNSVSAIAAASSDAMRPEGIIMVGFCGATDPSLRTGDLHIARSFRRSDHPGEIPADSNLHLALCDATRRRVYNVTHDKKVTTQPSATVSAVANAATKAGLWQSLGATSVNMEDYWAAQVAADAGIPFASVRVVLDTAEQTLPDYVTTGGSTTMVAISSVIHPQRLLRLTQLARQIRVARRSLTRCVSNFVDSPHSAQPLMMAANA